MGSARILKDKEGLIHAALALIVTATHPSRGLIQALIKNEDEWRYMPHEWDKLLRQDKTFEEMLYLIQQPGGEVALEDMFQKDCSIVIGRVHSITMFLRHTGTFVRKLASFP